MLIVRGMNGLGDNIYQRPFIRAASLREAVQLETPWPELYADLPIEVLPSGTRLRTQAKNVARQPESRWARRWQTGARMVVMGYTPFGLAQGSIIKAMERLLPLDGAPLLMDLPEFGSSPLDLKPIAVVRPVTVRKEWRNEARNPRPEYVAEIADSLRDRYIVVSVADLTAGDEWLVEPAPPADIRFHSGELSFVELMALVQNAALLLGGVGWIVPASLAAKIPAFVILGGQGNHNAPERITDPRLDQRHLKFALPDRFCLCSDMRHPCDKTISDVRGQFEEWRGRLGL